MTITDEQLAEWEAGRIPLPREVAYLVIEVRRQREECDSHAGVILSFGERNKSMFRLLRGLRARLQLPPPPAILDAETELDVLSARIAELEAERGGYLRIIKGEGGSTMVAKLEAERDELRDTLKERPAGELLAKLAELRARLEADPPSPTYDELEIDVKRLRGQRDNLRESIERDFVSTEEGVVAAHVLTTKECDQCGELVLTGKPKETTDG